MRRHPPRLGLFSARDPQREKRVLWARIVSERSIPPFSSTPPTAKKGVQQGRRRGLGERSRSQFDGPFFLTSQQINSAARQEDFLGVRAAPAVCATRLR